MTRFIDTHCHLDLLSKEPLLTVTEAQTSGVDRFITIATDSKSQKNVINIINQIPNVFGSTGIHPHSSLEFSNKSKENIKNCIINEKKIVAVGEIGLDYHYMSSPKDNQIFAFEEQLKIAEIYNLPVILHTREAEEDTLEVLNRFSIERKGVAHSFTGSIKMAEKLLEKGWYLGFNGIVTFKNAENVRRVLKMVPLDKILLETDSPFLSPFPFRGKENSPVKIPVIANFISNLLNLTLDELSHRTSLNAKKLFRFN